MDSPKCVRDVRPLVLGLQLPILNRSLTRGVAALGGEPLKRGDNAGVFKQETLRPQSFEWWQQRRSMPKRHRPRLNPVVGPQELLKDRVGYPVAFFLG